LKSEMKQQEEQSSFSASSRNILPLPHRLFLFRVTSLGLTRNISWLMDSPNPFAQSLLAQNDQFDYLKLQSEMIWKETDETSSNDDEDEEEEKKDNSPDGDGKESDEGGPTPISYPHQLPRETSVGTMKKETIDVKITDWTDLPSILESLPPSASSVLDGLERVKGSPCMMDVIIEGQGGFGSGVTAAFYKEVSKLLSSVGFQALISPLFLDAANNHKILQQQSQEEEEMGDEGKEELDENDDDSSLDYGAELDYTSSDGLFPIPLSGFPSRKPWFEGIGQLMSRSLLDGYIFPINLASSFYEILLLLIRNQNHSKEELDREIIFSIILRSFGDVGSSYSQLKLLIQEEDDEKKPEYQESIEEMCLFYVDPITNQPIVDNGNEKPVTSETIIEYVNLLKDHWIDSSIETVSHTLNGLTSSGIIVDNLMFFSPKELQSIIQGEDEAFNSWTIQSLADVIRPSHGFTKRSPSYLLLLEILTEFSYEEKKEFVSFVSGCHVLPPGGLGGLNPLIEVCRRQQTINLHTTTATQDPIILPFARTCTHSLHIPPIEDKDELREAMMKAIQGSGDLIDRD